MFELSELSGMQAIGLGVLIGLPVTALIIWVIIPYLNRRSARKAARRSARRASTPGTTRAFSSGPLAYETPEEADQRREREQEEKERLEHIAWQERQEKLKTLMIALVGAIVILCFFGGWLWYNQYVAEEIEKKEGMRSAQCQAMLTLVGSKSAGMQLPSSCVPEGFPREVSVWLHPTGAVTITIPVTSPSHKLVQVMGEDVVLAELDEEGLEAWAASVDTIGVSGVRGLGSGVLDMRAFGLALGTVGTVTVTGDTVEIETTFEAPAYNVELLGSAVRITVPGSPDQQAAVMALGSQTVELPYWMREIPVPEYGVLSGEFDLPSAGLLATMAREKRLQALLPVFVSCANTYEIHPAVAIGVAEQESGFNPLARSWKGAEGVMQMMPKTAESLGLPVAERRDPVKNICAGTKHLAELVATYGRLDWALAAYNGGPDAVEPSTSCPGKRVYECGAGRTDRNSFYGQTRPYVRVVTANIARYQQRLDSGELHVTLVEVDPPKEESDGGDDDDSAADDDDSAGDDDDSAR